MGSLENVVAGGSRGRVRNSVWIGGEKSDMRVQFDLRPAGMLEKERKKKSFNISRVLAILLMMAFFATSGGYIVVITWKFFMLKDEVATIENIVAGLEAEKSLLERQVSELRAREKVFADTLKIMNDDLPTVEVMHALESNMDAYGIGFETMRFVIGRETRGGKEPDVLEVTGLVASNEQIIEFSDRLRGSGVFKEVSLPVTTLIEQTGMVSFTLRMQYFAIGDIERP
jgi:cell division protein FtsL